MAAAAAGETIAYCGAASAESLSAPSQRSESEVPSEVAVPQLVAVAAKSTQDYLGSAHSCSQVGTDRDAAAAADADADAAADRAVLSGPAGRSADRAAASPDAAGGARRSSQVERPGAPCSTPALARLSAGVGVSAQSGARSSSAADTRGPHGCALKHADRPEIIRPETRDCRITPRFALRAWEGSGKVQGRYRDCRITPRFAPRPFAAGTTRGSRLRHTSAIL